MKCLQCSNEFTPTRPWQKFCSQAHKDAYHVEERQKLRYLQIQYVALTAELKEKNLELDELRRELSELRHKLQQPPLAFSKEFIREIVDGH